MKNRMLLDLGDYIAEIEASQPNELAGFYKDQDDVQQVVNVLDNDMFKTYFENFFYSYSYVTIKRDVNASEVVEAFNNMWKIFQIEQMPNINKLVQAYYWDYVPVYNYDRTEKWTDVRSGSETDEGSDTFGKKDNKDVSSGKYKDTNTPSGSYRDTTQNGATTRTDKEATMDTSSFQNKAQSEVGSVTNYNERTYNQYKEETERTFDNYQQRHTEEEREDLHGNEHTYHDVTDIHDARMYGNIGVVTNMAMIQEEFEGRVHSLGYEFLKRFFDKFFVMV
jgi:hypothetical protein